MTTPKDGDAGDADIPCRRRCSIGTGVVAVEGLGRGRASTGGTATPAGSVAFSLCKVDAPGLCTTGGTSVGSTNLTGAAYPVTVHSPTAYVTSAGRYCWRATFSGDAANGIPGSSDSTATECFTVNPVTPTLSTTAGADVNLGSAVTDSAALGGTATQPANPVINLTGTGRRGSRRHDHLQAVRPEQLHHGGVHLGRRAGQRQRHLQHPTPVHADRAPATTTGWRSTAATRRTPTA